MLHPRTALVLVLAMWAGCVAEEPSGTGTSGRGGGPSASGGASAPGSGGATAGGSGGSAGSTGVTIDAAPPGGGSGGGTGGASSGLGTGGAPGDGGIVVPPDGGDHAEAAPAIAGAVVWNIDNLQSIGGQRTTVVGAPTVIESPAGRALQFDGRDDALFVEAAPLQGLQEFTVEVIMRPDSGGSGAQRYFHLEEDGGGRVLFETRLMGDRWVADVFVESRAGEVALYNPRMSHPLDAWYNVTAVIDGKRARHFVNGVEELGVNLGFTPQGKGRTSIGVRINRLYWFKGAIRQARFTPRALTPDQFLKPN